MKFTATLDTITKKSGSTPELKLSVIRAEEEDAFLDELASCQDESVIVTIAPLNPPLPMK